MKKLTQKEIDATRTKIAKYIWRNVERGHYPGFLEIQAKLRVRLHTYFETIAKSYELAGLEYKRSNFWKERREKRRKVIRKVVINLIRKEDIKGRQLTKRQIESKFRIFLGHYFGSLREAHKRAGVEFKPHFGPRTKEEKQKTKQAMIRYVKEKVLKERYFPDIHELKRAFRVGIETYFPGGIREIIKESGFKERNFSAFWVLEKERRLQIITQYLLECRGYRIISKQNRIGPDIVVKKNGNSIPIELKAFRKNSYIPSRLVSRSPIDQLSSYIKQLNAPFGMLVTTAEALHPKYKKVIPKNIKIWFYKDIIKALPTRNSFLKDLEFIRATFPSFNANEKVKKVRQEIVDYIKECGGQNRYPIAREIQREFKINVFSYFKDIFEAYKLAGIKYPAHKRRMGGRRLTREEKEKIRIKIASFVTRRSKKGLACGYNIIQKELRVAIPSYFSSMEEVYKKAGILL